MYAQSFPTQYLKLTEKKDGLRAIMKYLQGYETNDSNGFAFI